MNNYKYVIELEWINQDEFSAFLENAKERYEKGEAFTDTFCMKFANGNEHICNFSFNQESGFYFEESEII